MTFWSGSKRILMIFILTYKSDNSKTFPSLMQKGALKYFCFIITFLANQKSTLYIFYLAQEHFRTYGGRGRLAAKGGTFELCLEMKQVQSQDSRVTFTCATFKVRLPLGFLLPLM